MTKKLIFITLILLGISLFMSSSAPILAQGPEDDGIEISYDPPPPPPAYPTTVEVGFFIRQITNIDQIAEDFTVEAFWEWRWQDPRLAFDAEIFGADEKRFINEEVESLLFRNEIWFPELEIVNERGSRDMEERAIVVKADGTVVYEERFSAKIQADYNLRRFPFDDQEFFIRIESFIYESDEVVLQNIDPVTGFGDNLGEEEWILQAIKPSVANREDVRSVDGGTYSELSLELDLHRQIAFYVYRILFPLFLFVTILLAAFRLRDYELQLSVSTTGLLTLVAFDFAVSGDLPNLAYLTMMDSLVIMAYVLASVAVVCNLVSKRYQGMGREDIASRVNNIAGISLPILYILSFFIIGFVIY